MPSASDELREAWGGQDGIGEDKAHAFLTDRGWKETGNGIMRPPSGREITGDEWTALEFLIREWDFGYEPAELEVANLGA